MEIQYRNYFFLDEDLPDDLEPGFLETYFLDYTPAKWASETNGGSFMVRDDGRRKHGLIISHHPEHGICLSFTKSLKFKYETWVTVGDETRMKDTVVLDGEVLLPIGGFVSPSDAWPLVEGYMRDPVSDPSSPLLRRLEDVDWPEM